VKLRGEIRKCEVFESFEGEGTSTIQRKGGGFWGKVIPTKGALEYGRGGCLPSWEELE